MDYKIGQIVDGKVSGIQPYGAFISLDKVAQGLIHVSEIQPGYTKDIHELLSVGDIIKVQVIDIDEYSKKISLSIRTLDEKSTSPHTRRKRYFTNRNKKIGFASLQKSLTPWINEDLAYLEKIKK